MSIDSAAPVGQRDASDRARRAPLANRLLAWTLRSPVSGVVDSALVLLTVRGRRTGRSISLPVQYAAGHDALWVWPGHPERKTWWRNLRQSQRVMIRLRGRDVNAVARVVDGAREPSEILRGLRAYVSRFPRAATPVVGGAPTDDRLRAVAGRMLLVRIDVAPEVLVATRQATTPPGRRGVAAIRRHPLASYFLLAIATSWAYWIPLALSGGDGSHMLGLIGPAVAGMVVTAIVDGRAGMRDLSARIARWKVALRWYAAAFAPLITGMIGVAVVAVTGGGLPSWERLASFAGLPALSWLFVFVMVLGVNGFGEEIGWRGVAWPRLRSRHTFGGATLLLTMPWAIWHLPTFWLDTGLADLPLAAVAGWIIGLAAGAVVLGWLYERAGSSLLIVALFHASLNMASATAGTAGLPAALTTTAVIAAAVVILRRQPA